MSGKDEPPSAAILSPFKIPEHWLLLIACRCCLPNFSVFCPTFPTGPFEEGANSGHLQSEFQPGKWLTFAPSMDTFSNLFLHYKGHCEQQDKGVFFFCCCWISREKVHCALENIIFCSTTFFFNVHHSEVLIKQIYRNVIETYYVVMFINWYKKILSLSFDPLVVCYTICLDDTSSDDMRTSECVTEDLHLNEILWGGVCINVHRGISRKALAVGGSSACKGYFYRCSVGWKTRWLRVFSNGKDKRKTSQEVNLCDDQKDWDWVLLQWGENLAQVYPPD